MPNYGRELIEIVTKDISSPTRLHVCGDVSRIIPKLLELPIDILSANIFIYYSYQNTRGRSILSEKNRVNLGLGL